MCITLIDVISTLRQGADDMHRPHLIMLFTERCTFHHLCLLIKAEWRVNIQASTNYIPPLVRIMACRLLGAKPLSEPMLGLLLIRLLGALFNKILIKVDKSSFMKMNLKILSAKWQPFCLGFTELMCTCRRLMHVHVLGNLQAQWGPNCASV